MEACACGPTCSCTFDAMEASQSDMTDLGSMASHDPMADMQEMACHVEASDEHQPGHFALPDSQTAIALAAPAPALNLSSVLPETPVRLTLALHLLPPPAPPPRFAS